jgi:cellulose synthase/poly-beta-1,6-N-acetylglucosamine synthase-like glycosyltransferase
MLFLPMNNWFTKHISAHLEFVLLGVCFYFLFTDKRFKNGLLILGGIYTVFSVLDTIYLEPLSVAPGNIILVGSVINILCALGLFYQIFREGKVLYIERHPYFWLSSSILVYFGCTLFISMFLNYLVFNLPLWMYDIFFFVDLFIFFVSKVFLLYSGYLLAYKYKKDVSLIQPNIIKTA